MKNIDVAKVINKVLEDIEMDLYYHIHEIDNWEEDPFIGFKYMDQYILADETGIDTISPDISEMIKTLESYGYTIIKNVEGVSFKEEKLGKVFK